MSKMMDGMVCQHIDGYVYAFFSSEKDALKAASLVKEVKEDEFNQYNFVYDDNERFDIFRSFQLDMSESDTNGPEEYFLKFCFDYYHSVDWEDEPDLWEDYKEVESPFLEYLSFLGIDNMMTADYDLHIDSEEEICKTMEALEEEARWHNDVEPDLCEFF